MKFKTESGDTINYEAKEVVSEVKTFEVTIDTEFVKDTITISSEKENIEEAIEYALEGKNTMFRKKNKEAKQKLLDSIKEKKHGRKEK